MVYYTLRLTPYPQNSVKDAFVRGRIDEFLNMNGSLGYLYGRETTKNIHYHMVFEVDGELDVKKFRDNLYESFEVPNDKRGNTSYSLKEVLDFQKACAYAVKDGDISSSIGWTEQLRASKKISKKKKQSSKELMADLQSRFNNNEINERRLWIELVIGRAYLGIPHRTTTINEIVEMMKINKNPEEYATELWEKNNIKLR